MKRTIFAFCLISFVAMPVWAHHAFVAAYDMSQPITVHGTITKVLLENPHSWFYLDVKDPSGKTEEWAFEAGTPSGMLRNGYKPKVIKAGVEVTIKGFRARDVSKKRGMMSQLTTVPVSFDPTPLTQGTVDGWFSFITNEPNLLAVKGVKTTTFLLNDFNYPSITNTYFVTGDYLNLGTRGVGD